MNIVPGVGIGPLRFGMTPPEIETRFGKPDCVSQTEEGETEWEYASSALSLYFDGSPPRLSSALVQSPGATLFDEPVIGIAADTFVDLVREMVQ